MMPLVSVTFQAMSLLHEVLVLRRNNQSQPRLQATMLEQVPNDFEVNRKLIQLVRLAVWMKQKRVYLVCNLACCDVCDVDIHEQLEPVLRVLRVRDYQSWCCGSSDCA